ncbi:hypothetical protein DPX16_9650 [Anabarilius grahami]|uniref:Uncharacterized protein n=1 Tax=Anabarilius grahami TaxID=495550 RepID=A0A3N0Y395_ANAGA|nr:hypothetical protein DPX16_9650 [Anabarilius grahami]
MNPELSFSWDDANKERDVNHAPRLCTQSRLRCASIIQKVSLKKDRCLLYTSVILVRLSRQMTVKTVLSVSEDERFGKRGHLLCRPPLARNNMQLGITPRVPEASGVIFWGLEVFRPLARRPFSPNLHC